MEDLILDFEVFYVEGKLFYDVEVEVVSVFNFLIILIFFLVM